MLQNLAGLQGQKSLHHYLIGGQGARAESDNPNFPARRPLRRALTTSQLHLASPALQRTSVGYDYRVVSPETTASHAR